MGGWCGATAADAIAMKTRMRLRSPIGGGVCLAEHNGKKCQKLCTGEVLPLDRSLLMGDVSPALWGASGPSVVPPHGADVFPTPRPVGRHAWGSARPTRVRAIPHSCPAQNRSFQTHSPRLPAPRALGHECALSV